MNSSILLGSALAVALSAPAMAADFHALKGLQGATPAPLQDGVLAAAEGGAVCALGTPFAADSQGAGGVCLVSFIGGSQGAFFSVTNAAPVSGANFLQVTGGL